MRKLLELSGISQKVDYKALSPKEISKSEKHVSKVIDVLEHDCLNSFNVYLKCEDVYNLSSEKVYDGDTDKLVEILELGEIEAKAFIYERIKSTTKLFHDTIPRQNPTLFRDQNVEISNKDQSEEVIKVNRDLLGKLSSLSTKFDKPILKVFQMQ